MAGKYDAILNSERPTDPEHLPMSLHDRAAQFAPFDALTGFGGRIHEASRLTDARIEPGEEARTKLDRTLTLLQAQIKERPELTLTHFVPDRTKEGGAYRTETVRLRSLDKYSERLLLEDRRSIAFEDILDIVPEACPSEDPN